LALPIKALHTMVLVMVLPTVTHKLAIVLYTVHHRTTVLFAKKLPMMHILPPKVFRTLLPTTVRLTPQLTMQLHTKVQSTTMQLHQRVALRIMV
jgi:hypothetical protein